MNVRQDVPRRYKQFRHLTLIVVAQVRSSLEDAILLFLLRPLLFELLKGEQVVGNWLIGFNVRIQLFCILLEAPLISLDHETSRQILHF